MITLLVGHRGVGKTSLLKRIPGYIPGAVCIDLDDYIGRASNQSVNDIFRIYGESFFRGLEKKYLQEIISFKCKGPLFIAAGGGFELDYLNLLTERPHVLWVRRKTDRHQRFFRDRPKIEYSERFEAREAKFKQYYDECLILPEGMETANPLEAVYFQNKLDASGASLSLLPAHFRSPLYLEKRKSWKLSYLEFRDDLLKESHLEQLLKYKNDFNILYAFREQQSDFKRIFNLDLNYDWPLEWGDPPQKVQVLSWHGDFVPKVFDSYKNERAIFKFAPLVQTFSQLLEGHRWHLQHPEKNNFLPRGRQWHWYRLLMKFRLKINFLREDDGTSFEQPTLMQWLMVPRQVNSFGAVLGNPVDHSRSPYFHHNDGAFFDISLKEEEWDEALNVLKTLGLDRAAVTSPLKNKINGNNTLKRSSGQWLTANTDQPALEKLLNRFKAQNTAVWGGGGILNSLKETVPGARFYSARTGEPRDQKPETQRPELVIWASGASDAYKKPPFSWEPQMVFDLNYTESSPGLQFALESGADYISGLDLFNEQARLQKEFWR